MHSLHATVSTVNTASNGRTVNTVHKFAVANIVSNEHTAYKCEQMDTSVHTAYSWTQVFTVRAMLTMRAVCAGAYNCEQCEQVLTMR